MVVEVVEQVVRVAMVVLANPVDIVNMVVTNIVIRAGTEFMLSMETGVTTIQYVTTQLILHGFQHRVAQLVPVAREVLQEEGKDITILPKQMVLVVNQEQVVNPVAEEAVEVAMVEPVVLVNLAEVGVNQLRQGKKAYLVNQDHQDQLDNQGNQEEPLAVMLVKL